MTLRTGFRANSNRSGGTPATDWARLPESLAQVARRFQGVTIEQRPALEVMAQHDGPATLHYLDPPYVHATRSSRFDGRNDYHGYAHEMTDADHAALLEAARGLAGMVVLSGYPHPLYDAALPGWARHEREALADGARPRVEALWLNPAATAALNTARGVLPLEVA